MNDFSDHRMPAVLLSVGPYRLCHAMKCDSEDTMEYLPRSIPSGQAAGSYDRLR